MPDSETTRRQKRLAFDELRAMVQYLETHGLDGVDLWDLNVAVRALDNMDVGTRR